MQAQEQLGLATREPAMGDERGDVRAALREADRVPVGRLRRVAQLELILARAHATELLLQRGEVFPHVGRARAKGLHIVAQASRRGVELARTTPATQRAPHFHHEEERCHGEDGGLQEEFGLEAVYRAYSSIVGVVSSS